MMGVANSYTMEASFAGSTLGSRVDTHFNVQDFENMGKAFCETLLDFCDEEPSKEKLRLKIIERLVKEGSSADEPTNINLSDYSSDEGDSSSCLEDELVHKEENPVWNAEGARSFSGTFVARRPPSSTPPKMEFNPVKQKNRVNSAKMPKKVALIEKTPPLPRKTLQVHKTILDPPCRDQNDGLDLTTEIDSGEESTSWQKNIRRLRAKERGEKVKKKHMPPELIVTPAQVFETFDPVEKLVFQKSKNSKRKIGGDDSKSDKYRLWRHAKCLQAKNKSEKSMSDSKSEIHLKMGTTLKQRIWTGCSCADNQTEMPLSRGPSLNSTHWTKGPLAWTSNIVQQNNTELKALMHKHQQTSSFQKNFQRTISQKDHSVEVIHKKEKHQSKKTLKAQQSNAEADEALPDNLIKSSQKKSYRSRKGVKQLSFPVAIEPLTQVALLKLTDSSSKPRISKDGGESKSKSASKTNKFRKSGLIIAAVTRRRHDTPDSDSEKYGTEKHVIKKKKKRKRNETKKTRCLHSPAKGDIQN